MHNIEIELVLGLFILGSSVVALIYHVVVFLFSKDKFLVHYLVYLFFTSIFLFLNSGLFEALAGLRIEQFVMRNFKEAVQILYLTSYFNFIVEAVGISKRKGSFLFRYWAVTASMLIAYSIVYSLCKLFTSFDDYAIPFAGVRIFIFIVTGMMLYQSYQLRQIKFQLIILYGCTFYFICGLISFVTNLYDYTSFWIYPLEWLMIGTFVDIIFFSFAIGYRNKKQWQSLNLSLLEEANKFIALQQVILEKQSELENERKRIAADMHDDLGSGLTKITYLSQMAMDDSDTGGNLAKIKATATELIGNMSELIWVMKEENNTLEDLATYIKSYAVDYLEANDIEAHVSIPEDFRGITLSGNERRNLFLCVKESLHNIIKHANAKNVSIEVRIGDSLSISITDDGIGLQDAAKKHPLHGNGIRNMKNRVESVCGSMQLTSDNGVTTVFNIPLSLPAQNEPFVPLQEPNDGLSFAPLN